MNADFPVSNEMFQYAGNYDLSNIPTMLGEIPLKVSSVRYFSTKDTSNDTVSCY